MKYKWNGVIYYYDFYDLALSTSDRRYYNVTPFKSYSSWLRMLSNAVKNHNLNIDVKEIGLYEVAPNRDKVTFYMKNGTKYEMPM